MKIVEIFLEKNKQDQEPTKTEITILLLALVLGVNFIGHNGKDILSGSLSLTLTLIDTVKYQMRTHKH